jgi:fibronectin type III domain protein
MSALFVSSYARTIPHSSERGASRSRIEGLAQFLGNTFRAQTHLDYQWARSAGIVLFCSIIGFISSNGFGSSLTLAWDPIPGTNVIYYTVHYGTASRVYTRRLPVGTATSATINGLAPGTTYFFSVSALKPPDLQSGFSSEIFYTISAKTPAMHLRTRPGGNLLVEGTGPPGHIYDVLATEDFLSWKEIGTITADQYGLFALSDRAARECHARFYQLHEVTHTAPGSLPRLQITEPEAGEVRLIIHGQIGHTYSILASDNSNPWIVVSKVTMGRSGVVEMIAPAGIGAQALLYQVQESP